MSNKLNRIYIGSICNRDLVVFDKIKRFCSKNYNISIITLLKKGSNSFSAKYLKKQLKKYPLSFIIVKLLSEEDNQDIYKAIKEIAPNIPLLNNRNAVKTCESRRETFRSISLKCKKLVIPQSFYSIIEAKKHVLMELKLLSNWINTISQTYQKMIGLLELLNL